MKRAFPLVIGVIPFGLAYGISASSAGLRLHETVFMSMAVFAGASQFVAVEMMRQQSLVVFILAMTFIINLRHILMALSLKSYVRQNERLKASLLSFGLVDESYAVSSLYFREKKEGRWSFLFSASLLMYIGWAFSSSAGFLLGDRIADPLAWGLDFAMPATFIGILIPQIQSLHICIVVFVAGASAVLFKVLLGGSYYIIIAAVAGAMTGYLLERRIP
ncbi:MAG: AzlC family ABC transporter permease [Syntrophales bacterium]|nr:AzlC family ABC transporter permease [Syntrophales bacterium]MCK9528392.1 AzlC family ABC transporter permease [Syntrophales bacterium]MDX9922683.1 AzlC family ABC transporter permease [Syntrophales bacterium]